MEDDPDLRQAVDDALRAAGHDVASAADGRAALERLRTWQPDVLVLDLMLPVMDGWQVLAAKRQDPAISGIPTIVVSGNASPEAAAVQADLYILKPFDAPTVLQSISDILISAELRRDPQRAAQNERMAALGTLAAGVAHEINNPLTYVILQLERASGITAGVEQDDLRSQLEVAHQRALEGAFRIRDIARDVGAFCRAAPAACSLVDMREAVLVAARLVRHQLAAASQIDVAAGAIPLVFASEGRLVQVFVNLLVNAVQAMPEERRPDLRISVAFDEDEHGWACVNVADNGLGIAAHVIGRIFEPFFTTKGDRQGTGLGLSVSHGIVLSFGGEITVTSVVEQGTRFRVRLPPATTRRAHAAARPDAARRDTRCRILIIDDEPNLRAAVVEALIRDEVVAVASGRAALAMLVSDDRFDVIICDVHMADIDGVELFAQVQTTRPHLASRFLFMTGGAMSNAHITFLDSTSHEVLHKPFSAVRLREAIDAVRGSAWSDDA